MNTIFFSATVELNYLCSSGPAKKYKLVDKDTNRVTAYHEAGHTLVAYFTQDVTPLHKVTIIPRGMSLGHVSATSV